MSEHKNDENAEMETSNIVQRFGKYHVIQYFLICMPAVIIAMNNVNYVFVAGDIDYRCRVPECETVDGKYSPSWWPDEAIDRCSRPELNYTYLQTNQCDEHSFVTTLTECTEWIYGSNDTIVAWLNLACKPWKTNFVGTIHMMGWILGMVVGGWASDTFGRKPTCIVAEVGMMVGVTKTLISSYYGYIFVELIESTVGGIAFSSGMVLIFEISSVDKRVLAGALHAYAIYFGEALIALIAMLVSYWKFIIYIAYAPSILFLFYIILLQESPGWLVLNAKFDKARNNLKLISAINKLNINPEYIDRLDERQLRKIFNIDINTKKEGYKEAFKSKEIIKRIIVATVGRFTVTFIYYGLVASSVWLPGDKYTNYILTALMSFPGDLIALYFLNRIGRRMSLFYGYLICGVACVASVNIPEYYLWLRIVLYLIAKLLVAACYTGIWTYTMELFPTSVRGSMFGLVTLTASVGSLLAPLTPAMDTISPLLSPALYGVSSITSAFLMLFSPETKGLPLAGTIEEVVNTMNKKSNNINMKGQENQGFE